MDRTEFLKRRKQGATQPEKKTETAKTVPVATKQKTAQAVKQAAQQTGSIDRTEFFKRRAAGAYQPEKLKAARSAAEQVSSPAPSAQGIRNAAQSRSGKSREAYDSSMRDRYTQREAQRRIAQLKEEKSRLEAGLDLNGAAEVQARIDKLSGPGSLSRIGSAILSGGKGTAASNANAMTTLYQTGQGRRTRENQEYLAEYAHGLERARNDMNAMLAENREKPGTAGR